MSQSPYAYCGGDPVNNNDPSGHETEDVVFGDFGLRNDGERDFGAMRWSTFADAYAANLDGGGIPVGGIGTYNPSTDTLTFKPVTYRGGSTTFGIGNLTSSPQLVGSGSASVAGGSLTFNGNYAFNGSGGSLQGQYSHPINGGVYATVQFGTGRSPAYGLAYGLSY